MYNMFDFQSLDTASKWASILSLIIAIISIAFGIAKYIQMRKLKRLTENEAITLHQNIAVALGAIQAAKSAASNNQNPHFEIGRAEGLCQGLLYNSAAFFSNLANLSRDDVNKRIADERLSSTYREIYHLFATRKAGILRKYAWMLYCWLW